MRKRRGVANDQLRRRVRLHRVVSIGKLAVGQERYYLEQAPERVDAGTDSNEDYYLDPAEVRGEWRGRAAASLGLSGSVGADPLRRLLEPPSIR